MLWKTMQPSCQPAKMDDGQYVMASDGRLARKSGLWAKRKHHYLRKYCGITTKSMRKKWRLVYWDVMAGPGLCKIKDTERSFPVHPSLRLSTSSTNSYLSRMTPDWRM